MYPCTECGNLYSSEASLRSHCMHSHPKYTCDICKMYHSTQLRLDKHIIFAHSGPFKCTSCVLTFNSEYLLMRHMMTHLPEEDRTCPLCGKVYKSPIVLKDHLKYYCKKIHSTSPPKPIVKTIAKKEYTCEACGEDCGNSKTLYKHIRTHDNIMFKCNICAKIFASSLRLAKHNKQYHEGIFKCDKCPLSFNSRYILKRHATSHLPESERTCKICDKVYKTVKILNDHVRTCHGGEGDPPLPVPHIPLPDN